VSADQVQATLTMPSLPLGLAPDPETASMLAGDSILLLREARRYRCLSQQEVAAASGVGVKTISSFETGRRFDSLKVRQLRKLLRVYGLTMAQFFAGEIRPNEATAADQRRRLKSPEFYAQFICSALYDAEQAGVPFGSVIEAVYSMRSRRAVGR
jgi:transcriptional regulator with XRE-family HTH domain